MSERLKKLNELLREEISKIFLRELSIPDGVFITIVRADISPTLEHANIFISVLPENKAKEILKQIKSQIYDLQQTLNKRLAIRPVPKIRFEIDATEARAGRIDKLLQKVGEK